MGQNIWHILCAVTVITWRLNSGYSDQFTCRLWDSELILQIVFTHTNSPLDFLPPLVGKVLQRNILIQFNDHLRPSHRTGLHWILKTNNFSTDHLKRMLWVLKLGLQWSERSGGRIHLSSRFTTTPAVSAALSATFSTQHVRWSQVSSDVNLFLFYQSITV